MPFVRVLHKPFLEPHELDKLSVMLRKIVSQVLTIDEDKLTWLTERDIVLTFKELGPRGKMDNDVELDIECDNYPSRLAIRGQLINRIWEMTIVWMDLGRALGVYLKFVDAEFKEGRKT